MAIRTNFFFVFSQFFDADQVSLVQQIAFGRTATDRQVISILANYK